MAQDDKEVVQMSKQDLRDLISEVETKSEKKFSERLAKQDEQIKILTEASDIVRLSRAMSGKQGPRKHTMQISTYDGKVVVGWEKVIDTVEKQNNIWIEKQIYRMILEDGTKVDMPYEEFHRRLQDRKITCDVLARTVDAESGNEIVKLKRQDNGKVLEMDIVFVN